MTLQRRDVVLAAALGAALPAWAEGYPNKPIKLILSFPPGSTSDLLARYLGDKAAKQLGQPVIVESKPGAQGAIAARMVAKSPADGYTIFLGTNSTHAANVFLIKNLGYDPVRDFTPLTQCATNPLLLVVNGNLSVKSVKELIQYAKGKPGQLSYGSGNTGSLVAAQLFKSLAGIEAVGVNYPGVAQACNDLVGGRLDFMMVDPTVARPFIESGKVRVLGITSRERLPSMPQVAPLAESGIDRYQYASWAGFFAPRKLPEDIKIKLSRIFQDILSEPETEKYLSSMGMIVQSSTPQDFSIFVKNQFHIWEKLIKKSGLQSV